MAYSRATINYAALSETVKAETNQCLNFLTSKGFNAAEAQKLIDSVDLKNMRPAGYFGESNLQKGDIIVFPTKAELSGNIVPTAFMAYDRNEGKEVPRITKGLKVLTTANKKRTFFVSTLFSSAIDNQNGQVEVRSKLPQELYDVIYAGTTPEHQYELLCDYMSDKALEITDKVSVETPEIRQGRPVKRSIYTFTVLKD